MSEKRVGVCPEQTVRVEVCTGQAGPPGPPGPPGQPGGSGIAASWNKKVAAGVTHFSGLDDDGYPLEPQPVGTFFTLNGVRLMPDDFVIDVKNKTVILKTPTKTISDVSISWSDPPDEPDASNLTITTKDVSTIPGGTTPRAETIQPDFQNITNQYFANWWLYFEIEKVRGEIANGTGNGTGNGTVDLSNYATIAYSDAGDDALQAQINNLSLGGNGSIDLSNYALLSYVDAADADLQAQIDNLSVGGNVDLTTYAKIAYVDAADDAIKADVANLTLDLSLEQQERADGDAALQAQIDNITIPDVSDFVTETELLVACNATLGSAKTYTDDAIANLTPFDDTAILGNIASLQADLSAETSERIAADASLQAQIDNITIPDHSGFATKQEVSDGDNATLKAAKDYTDAEVAQEGQYRDVADMVLQQQINNLPTHAYVDFGDSTTLTAAKNYADAGDAATLQAAKDYSDSLDHSGGNLSGYVSKTGGDSMEGPLVMQAQDPANGRDTNRVHTLGIYSNSDGSALRLGTTRDRVYIGHDDTSFNGPVKIGQLQEKDAGQGISVTSTLFVDANGVVKRPIASGSAGDGFVFHGRPEGGTLTQTNEKLLSVFHNSGTDSDAVNYIGKTSNANNIQNRKAVLAITDPIQGEVDQNKQDIISLFQEINALSKPLAGGKYTGISSTSVGSGQFHLNTGSYATSGPAQLTFNEYDEDGVKRSWADVDPGDYIVLQSRASANYGVYVVASVTQAGNRYVVVGDQVEGKGNHIGSTLVKIYNLAASGLDLAELDQRYLRKDFPQTTTGQLKFQITTGTCLQSHDDTWQIWRDGTFVTARTSFSSNHLVTQSYVSSNFASKSHNHDGVYAPADHTHDFSVSDATQAVKGIAFLGQAVTGTSSAPSIKSGQLYWNTSTKVLYIGN